MDNRTDKIEETLAHQEQQINDLNDIVTKQWNEIDRLTKTIERLGHKVQELETVKSEDREGLSVTEEAALNKPPHY